MVEMAQSEFCKLDELKMTKNIDRIVKVDSEHDQFMVFSYHYDKQLQTKSSTYALVEVTSENKIKLLSESEANPYGVLSAKLEAEGLYSVGCSDATIKLLTLPSSKHHA